MHVAARHTCFAEERKREKNKKKWAQQRHAYKNY